MDPGSGVLRDEGVRVATITSPCESTAGPPWTIFFFSEIISEVSV